MNQAKSSEKYYAVYPKIKIKSVLIVLLENKKQKKTSSLKYFE